MRRVLAASTALLIAALPAAGVEVVTHADVEIVEGIDVIETTGMNFGVLALNSGTVTIDPTDGSYSQTTPLVYDQTDISQGIFTVTSIVGVNLQLDCTAGTEPAGLTLGNFVADWADAGTPAEVPNVRTLVAATEVLELGADLTIDHTTAAPTGGTPAELPYTVTVVFE